MTTSLANTAFHLRMAIHHGEMAIYYMDQITGKSHEPPECAKWNDRHVMDEAMEAWHYASLLGDTDLEAALVPQPEDAVDWPF